jgi:hypothetical protein
MLLRDGTWLKLRRSRRLFRILVIGTLTYLAGCADPAARSEHIATGSGLTKQRLIGQGFAHIAYFNNGGQQPGSPLHVYLSGDGSPWINRTHVAADPTPRNPVALQLMALDPGPSLYLGRPCYHGLADSVGCDASIWTSGRYSERVADSMAAALQRFLRGAGYRRVVLIGYSGGGVLAWLLASRIRETELLVTVAANLDIDAWTRLHDYTPLYDSLNPATLPPLPPSIRQLHLVGLRDSNVPPSLVRAALTGAGEQAIVAAKPADHRCCWEGLWPGILQDIRRLSARPPK